MKVLQVVHALPGASYGGTELYTQWLSEALAREHDVAVATPRGTETDVEGATVHALPDTGGWTDDTGAESGLERDVVDELVDETFVGLLEAIEPDVVHFQHLKNTSATLPEHCRERGIPTVLTLHDFFTQCHRTQLHRPDGRPCSGPESVEKCTACYADALERAERRCDDPSERDHRSERPAAGESTDPAGAEGSVDPPEPSPLRDGATDVGETREGSPPPTIDDIDLLDDATDEPSSDGTAGEPGSDDTAGELGSDDATDEQCSDDATEEQCSDDATDDGAATSATSGGASEDGPDAFEQRYDLDLLGRPDVGLADLGRSVTRRSERLEAALEATDLLVAPSAFLRDRFVEFGVDDEQIVHCRTGIRVDDYSDTGFDAAESVALGFAGRLAPEKGVDVLIEAFRTLDGDATLHLFGAFDPVSNAYHARLRELAAGERVTFHGSYEQNATPFDRIDALVLPSQGYENSPLVIQEAFAAGVPVVAGDDGGTAELITDGEDGLTYPIGDPVALADCLQLLVDDPRTVERLRAGVERPTSMEHHARQVQFLYGVLAVGQVEQALDGELSP